MNVEWARDKKRKERKREMLLLVVTITISGTSDGCVCDENKINCDSLIKSTLESAGTVTVYTFTSLEHPKSSIKIMAKYTNGLQLYFRAMGIKLQMQLQMFHES